MVRKLAPHPRPVQSEPLGAEQGMLDSRSTLDSLNGQP